MSILKNDSKLQLPSKVDILVLGSGSAGMTAALSSSLLGLDVIVAEKTAKIGGTTAYSAGSIWVPNSRHNKTSEDSYDNALKYLRNAIGNGIDEERIESFLHFAPKMVNFLEEKTCVKLRAYSYHPDYLSNLAGATLSGRVLEPIPFRGSVLKNKFVDLRSPIPEFMLFNKIMVDRTDINKLMSIFKKWSSLWHSLKLFAQYGLDRILYNRGTRLVMGNALVGRLYYSLLENKVPVFLSTEATSLKVDNNRVISATLNYKGQTKEVKVKYGVILATGGFSNQPELRKNLIPNSLLNNSPVVDSATGDGFLLAKKIGGYLSLTLEGNSFLAPASKRSRPDGSIAVFPHFVLDRGKPGAIAIDPNGKRFVNEATTYHLFGKALLKTLENFTDGSCYLICDHNFIKKYGLGMIRPYGIGLSSSIKDGYVKKANSIKKLGYKINVPINNLESTISRHNSFVKSGIDEDFEKGNDAYQKNIGDPLNPVNPCLGMLNKPPFYAIEIFPCDIGASAGLATNSYAQVLKENEIPINGLYACGNDMKSIMEGKYPGPGITIGAAMTFGFIAANHAYELKTKKTDSN
jgi:succinate dehydrogenase/fumarate reductase flavoprotein subunit